MHSDFPPFHSDPVLGPGKADRASVSKLRQTYASSFSPPLPGGLLAIRRVLPEPPLSDTKAGLLIGFPLMEVPGGGQLAGRRFRPKQHLKPCRGVGACSCPGLGFSHLCSKESRLSMVCSGQKGWGVQLSLLGDLRKVLNLSEPPLSQQRWKGPLTHAEWTPRLGRGCRS